MQIDLRSPQTEYVVSLHFKGLTIEDMNKKWKFSSTKLIPLEKENVDSSQKYEWILELGSINEFHLYTNIRLFLELIELNKNKYFSMCKNGVSAKLVVITISEDGSLLILDQNIIARLAKLKLSLIQEFVVLPPNKPVYLASILLKNGEEYEDVLDDWNPKEGFLLLQSEDDPIPFDEIATGTISELRNRVDQIDEKDILELADAYGWSSEKESDEEENSNNNLN